MSAGDTGAPDNVTQRLEAMAAELKALEPLMRTGDIDARVLREFRDAVDFIRTTAWAVEQFIALRKGHHDPYSVMPMLAMERVRRGTQLAHDLSLDLDSTEVSFETPGLEGLFGAVRGLHEKLEHLFHQDRR
ncbi:MAG: hypothetical protein M1453_04305 [Acidobacteria bacterium]|nr:hypothetical protein [Acidobacteriota bacterium]MCL5287201.1 hypothetical protein [Acidobacteriota bacterium]